jgi:hypothetical protein
MKIIKILFALFPILTNICLSQIDSLYIHLKNKKIESIAINQIHKIALNDITGISENVQKINSINIISNSPNPAIDNTIIKFDIAMPGTVLIKVFDIHGNLVKRIEYLNCRSGLNEIYWDCKDMNDHTLYNGIYFYEVFFFNEKKSRKLIILK